MFDKKTKIICTIGPASDSFEMIKALADNGMNVARLNFSHGSYEEHSKRIDTIRKLNSSGYNIGIMLDTKGPEIRICRMENDGVEINKGDLVKISMIPVELGSNKLISVSYPGLINCVKKGTIIKIDDGKMNFEVENIDKKENYILVRAINSHLLKSKKSVGVPFTKVDLPFISEKDKKDLIFACEKSVDFVAASFTRSADDLIKLKNLLKENNGENIKVLAKIENQEGVDNIDEILEVADGIMVARGDLGIELDYEDVPVFQKMLIQKARNAGKICIIATQMLDSMQNNPAPTRAEVSDVANAVYHGVDAIMLSGETASGEYPLESCQMEARIARRVEKELNYNQISQDRFNSFAHKDNSDAIAYSVCSTALITNSALIICFSKTGNTARRVSSYHPECPIISISSEKGVRGKLSLNFGVYGIKEVGYKIDLKEFENIAVKVAKEHGVKEGQTIVLTGGDQVGGTNFMKIIEVK